MHELRLIEAGGQLNAVHLGVKTVFADLRSVDHPLQEGWLADVGIREVDVRTNQTLFEWWPSDHINAAESNSLLGIDSASIPQRPWNWLYVIH